MGLCGILFSYCIMNGYFLYIYLWVNVEGKIIWVKYYFISDQGVYNMIVDWVKVIVGDYLDIYCEDFFNYIVDGDYLFWIVKVQFMFYDEVKDYWFNLFDIIKVWLYKDYLLYIIGKFILDCNLENFFVQIE